MDFNNTKVRQAVIAHLDFAIASVDAVYRNRVSDDEMIVELQNQQKAMLTTQILNFTLVRDIRLANSLKGLNESHLREGEKLEDFVL